MSTTVSNGTLDIYATRTQLEAIQFEEPTPSMFGNTFFNGESAFFQTKKVEWDEVRIGASSARFVAEKLWVTPTEKSLSPPRKLKHQGIKNLWC